MKIFPGQYPSTLFLLAGGALLLGSGGCMDNRQAYRGSSDGRMGTAGVYVDDYDYFPGYETYYSRNSHEYYYREGSIWVSHPQPRGVTVEVLRAAPSIRMDFHDAPSAHHNTVVRAYPRNWKRPEPVLNTKAAPQPAKPAAPKPAQHKNDAKDERPDDKRDERKENDRKK